MPQIFFSNGIVVFGVVFFFLTNQRGRFYLWNTGLVTGLATPHSPKNNFELFRQACFT